MSLLQALLCVSAREENKSTNIPSIYLALFHCKNTLFALQISKTFTPSERRHENL